VTELRLSLRKALMAVLRHGAAVDDAQDLVQQAFLRVLNYEQNSRVKSQEAVLITTAVNLSIDEARRRKRSPFDTRASGIEQMIDAAPTPDDIVESRLRLQRASEGLDRLSEKSRRILLARRLENKSVVQIAASEGMSTHAVEKQIARATLSLLNWMDGW
jgi:RNA polymerase sigma-70 factor (ECF subfamily)